MNMDLKFRNMTNNDKQEVFSMMEAFYSSDAVYTNGSSDIFKSDIEYCINDNPYLKGFVFEVEKRLKFVNVMK